MCVCLAITLHRNGSSSPAGTSRVLRNRFSRYEFTFNVERTKERQGVGMLVGSVLWRRFFICAVQFVRIAINWEGRGRKLAASSEGTEKYYVKLQRDNWACCKKSVVVTARVSMMGGCPVPPRSYHTWSAGWKSRCLVTWHTPCLCPVGWHALQHHVGRSALAPPPFSPPLHSRGGKVLHSLASTTSSNSVLASLLASSDHTVTFSSSYSVAATRVYFPSYCLQLISSNTSYVSRLSHIQLN